MDKKILAKKSTKKIFDAAIEEGHNWKWIEIEGLAHGFPGHSMDVYFKEALEFLT